AIRAVRRDVGGRTRFCEGALTRDRWRRHHGEYDLSRPHRDRTAREDLRHRKGNRRGEARGARARYAGGTHRKAGGDRGPRRLPRLASRRVHHRQRFPCGWRTGSGARVSEEVADVVPWYWKSLDFDALTREF